MGIDIFRNSTVCNSFKQGDIIFSEGDGADLAYSVKEGEVQIMLATRVMERVLPGGIFGEMALIDEKTRSASAVAATDTVLVPITRDQLILLIREVPSFALDLMGVIAGRLRRQNAFVKTET